MEEGQRGAEGGAQESVSVEDLYAALSEQLAALDEEVGALNVTAAALLHHRRAVVLPFVKSLSAVLDRACEKPQKEV